MTSKASQGAAELQDNYASRRQMHNNGIKWQLIKILLHDYLAYLLS